MTTKDQDLECYDANLQASDDAHTDNWYFVRFDFGIYSRYTNTHDRKFWPADCFLHLAVLYSTEKEIKELFDQNWLTRFALCHMKNGKVTELETCGVPDRQ